MHTYFIALLVTILVLNTVPVSAKSGGKKPPTPVKVNHAHNKEKIKLTDKKYVEKIQNNETYQNNLKSSTNRAADVLNDYSYLYKHDNNKIAVYVTELPYSHEYSNSILFVSNLFKEKIQYPAKPINPDKFSDSTTGLNDIYDVIQGMLFRGQKKEDIHNEIKNIVDDMVIIIDEKILHANVNINFRDKKEFYIFGKNKTLRKFKIKKNRCEFTTNETCKKHMYKPKQHKECKEKVTELSLTNIAIGIVTKFFECAPTTIKSKL